MQRVPKLQQEDQAKWWDTLDRMQKLLRKAATTLYNQGQLDFESMHNYLMSGASLPLYLFINTYPKAKSGADIRTWIESQSWIGIELQACVQLQLVVL